MMKRLLLAMLLLAVALCWTGVARPALAGGISTDSGLTPAQNRIILRTRLAYLQRAASWGASPSMEMLMVPFVAAWGVLPELTVMGRTAVVNKRMSMPADGMMTAQDSSKTGMGDLLLQAKYKLYRWNGRTSVFGVAPTFGIEAPTGTDGFSSESWDLRAGLHVTHRWHRLSADLTATYVWNGAVDAGAESGDPGDELELVLAFTQVFRLPGSSTLALSPVLELSTGWSGVEDGFGSEATEGALFLSPGAMFYTRWVIFEVLCQVPVWQQTPAGMLERNIGLIGGLRFLL